MDRSWLAPALLSSCLLAQAPAPAPRPGPDHCLPDGHMLFVRANVTELCASPWWSALRDRPEVASFRQRFAERTGVPLEQLTRVTLAGSSQDWSQLCAVLEAASPAALDPRQVAARFQGRPPRPDAEERLERTTLILPPARSTAPAVLELRPGCVAVGAALNLRAAVHDQKPGRPAELLDAVMLAQDSTLVFGTSHEEPLVDIARWLDPGRDTELLGASCALVVVPTPVLELRLRCLEQDAAAPLLRRLQQRRSQLAALLQTAGRPHCARLLDRIEFETRGAEVRARLELGAEDTPAQLASELFGTAPAAAGVAMPPAAPPRR